MQGAVKAAIDYIDVSVRAGTQEPMLVTIRENRMQNLKLMLGRMSSVDLLDMTTAISTLGSTTAFTDEQRSSMIQSIHAKMQGDDGGATGVVGKAQTHPFIENYLTSKLWDQLHDKSLSEHDRVQLFVNHLHNRNGCKYPDVPSRRRFVAIIELASGNKRTPHGSKACFDLFATVNAKMRSVRAHIPCTVKSFPIDPQDFMLLYPNIYDADDPPITSRFSRAKIDEVWTSVPARQNNKLLATQSDTRIASLPACTMIDDPMRQMIENPMMMTMMRALGNLANMGQPSGRDMRPGAPCTIDFRRDPPTPAAEPSLYRPELPALSNGDGSSQELPTDTAAAHLKTSTTIHEDLDTMITAGLKAPPKAKVPKEEKKRGGNAKDDADHVDKRGGDGKGKKRDVDAHDHVDSRAPKRANTTKDYGTNLKTPPKLAGLILPCFFNKCKIYGTDKKFRVYPRPNESKYDKGFVFTAATKAKVWEKVIEYCKHPGIPKTSSNFVK
jgi:hypothetical protein